MSWSPNSARKQRTSAKAVVAAPRDAVAMALKVVVVKVVAVKVAAARTALPGPTPSRAPASPQLPSPLRRPTNQNLPKQSLLRLVLPKLKPPMPNLRWSKNWQAPNPRREPAI